MKSYVPPAGKEEDKSDSSSSSSEKDESPPAKKAKTAGAKAEQDPNKPKKPVGGGFGCFLDKHRAEFQTQSPGSSLTQISKMARDKWRAMSKEEREVYDKEYKVTVEAYKTAM